MAICRAGRLELGFPQLAMITAAALQVLILVTPRPTIAITSGARVGASSPGRRLTRGPPSLGSWTGIFPLVDVAGSVF